MIKVQNICKIYKNKDKEIVALEDLSFERNYSEIVGILGPNGAGKTTLIKILLGLIDVDNGRVRVNGYRPYKKDKSYLAQIGFVSGQKAILDQYVPVLSSLKLLGVMYGLSISEVINTVSHYAKKLGVEEFLSSEPRILSLGQRMKLELIASIYHSPKVIFLDEPTIGLDFESQKQVHNMLLEFQKNHNSMIVLTSHNGKDIKKLCNSIVVLEKGKKVFDGKIQDLEDSPCDTDFIKLLKEELDYGKI